jgi:hypothetical protein
MSSLLPSLAELFPDGNYEFHLTLRRTQPHAFFTPIDPTGAVLAERAAWLVSDPKRYAVLQPEGYPLVSEFLDLAATWGKGSAARDAGGDAESAVLELGRGFEPDILFLSPDRNGQFCLRGGALCFPTGWALEEKLGHTLDFIHGVVPGLNPALGTAIQQFLTKLRPGVAYLRHNWGLAATDALNLHPARQIPAPAAPVELEALWLRVEHQALLALPNSKGIVFAIRIALYRMDEVARGPARAGLRRALATMPFELVSYKRLDAIRDPLVALL